MVDRARQADVIELQKPLPLPVEMFSAIRPAISQRHLIKGMLLAGTSIVVFGHPGSGKTFAVIDWSLRIAAGLQWFGRKVQAGGVVYVAAEGQAGLRLRIEAWRRSHNDDGANLPFALIPVSVDLLDPRADLDKLATVLTHLVDLWGGIVLIVIDTLAATFGGGDENSGDMAAYIANVARLCAPYGCARIIVHHQPLNADAKRPRGHGSLWGAADTVVHITGDREAPARRISVMKQKDMDPGPDILFKLRPIEIGTDEDGESVTSCIIEPADETTLSLSKPGRRLSAKEKIALGQLERLLIEEGQSPPSDIPESALNRQWITKVSSMSAWRSAAMSALHTPDTDPDSARKAFNRSRDKLQAAEILAIWEDWVWLL